MNISNNTVLITGGGSGIGFETARLLVENGNKVIIAGRNGQKLQDAAATLKNIVPVVCDITKSEDVTHLTNLIKNDHKDLNMLINNAGKAYGYYASDENANTFEKAQEEMSTNFLAPVRLTELLLPLLKGKEEAAIVNISSIVSFAPGIFVPTYSATKAALHSFSQSMRFELKKSTNIKVFEVMPPLVDTELAKQLTGDKLHASTVAAEILKGLENDEYEMHIGATSTLYKLYLSSPVAALLALNRIN